MTLIIIEKKVIFEEILTVYEWYHSRNILNAKCCQSLSDIVFNYFADFMTVYRSGNNHSVFW